MTRRWTSLPPEEILWVAWEEDFALYDRTTGETHLLNALPAEILHILGDSPRPPSTESLATELAKRCETDADERWHQRISAILFNLESLGLVQEMER